MSQIDTEKDILSETGEEQAENLRLVPVSESIRYRKRAQSAEKKVEDLAEELSEVRAESVKIAEKLSKIETEQKLTKKLAGASAVDLETAVLIAQKKMEQADKPNIDNVIEEMKKEKPKKEF